MTDTPPTIQPAPAPRRMSQILDDADRVLASRQRAIVDQLETMRLERGEIMYDMAWMPAKRARRLNWMRRARSVIGAIEMIVVFLALWGVSQLLIMLLQQFTGLKD